MSDADTVLALIEDILDNHHVPLKAALPEVAAQLEGLIDRDFAALSRLLDSHLMKEETLLFPNIQGIARGMDIDGVVLLGPIHQMRYEHQQIEALVGKLRAAASPEQHADLIALLDDLVVHAGKEDETLFPMAFALAGMPEPDWEALEFEEPAAPRVVRPTPPRPEKKPRSRLRRLVRRLLD